MGGPAIVRRTRHKLKVVSHQVGQANQIVDNLSTDTYCQYDEHHHSPGGFFLLTSRALNNTPADHTNFDTIANHQLYNNVNIFLRSNKKSTMATRRPKHRRENFDVNDPAGKSSGAGAKNYHRHRRSKKRR